MILEGFISICCTAKVLRKSNGSIKCLNCDNYLFPEMYIKIVETESKIQLSIEGDGYPIEGYDQIREELRKYAGKNVTVIIKESQR